MRAAFLALSAALLMPLAAQAQNIAIVNGKAVPKARVDNLLQQAERAGQKVGPEMEAQAKDQVVLREIFTQEAETTGIAASADYRAQMELARQSILIRELFEDFKKKNPVSDADAKAEYDKFKAQAHRHRVPRPPHPGGEGRRGQGADRADQGRRQVRGTGQEELEGPGLRRQRRRPRLRQGRLLRARVRPGDDAS